LINLGGEQETPEFEDYQVNLGFSGYLRDFTGNQLVFRPFVDDTDPAVRAADTTASHTSRFGDNRLSAHSRRSPTQPAGEGDRKSHLRSFHRVWRNVGIKHLAQQPLRLPADVFETRRQALHANSTTR
jgi:hypothetical protein